MQDYGVSLLCLFGGKITQSMPFYYEIIRFQGVWSLNGIFKVSHT